MIYNKILSYAVVLFMLPALAGVFEINSNFEKAEAAFDYNNLCSDGAFINSGALDTGAVQNILRSKGSFLQNYSEGGRSAAQIIYDAARNERISPVTILAMIQKEQSLVYATGYNQYKLDWAMGYGVPDSGDRNYAYQGFTKQIDSGAWQLRRNYDYWAANGSAWNVGKTMNIDGRAVRFANRCTSALYRYTPHLGTNFTYYFNMWNTGAGSGAATGTYDAQYVTQGPRSGAGAPGVNLGAGQKFTIWVNYKNTGGAIWYKAGKNPVRLGMANPQDRGSLFTNGNNVRGTLVQTAVRPGQTGTFRIALTAPSQGGSYVERFRPVAEYINWMGEEAAWTFNVSGGRGAATTNNTQIDGSNNSSSPAVGSYNAQYVTQGPRSGAGSPNYTLSRGQKATLWVNYVNTGNKTWSKTGANPVHLGTTGPQDRGSAFFAGNNVRSRLVQQSVAPGATGTFIVTITAPQTPGTYTESFQPLTEYITWMGNPVTWTFTVR